MSIVKNGQWIAIDSVETDNTLSGTGRPGSPIGLSNPWKNTIEVWSKVDPEKIEIWTKIEPEKVEAWSKIPLPPNNEESKDKTYVWKNGDWTEYNNTDKINIVDGKHSTVVDVGDDKIKIDVDISPDLIIEKGCLDFTN